MSSKMEDLSGRRFGRLTVTALYSNKKKRSRWRCICDCGETRIVIRHNLVSGKTVSCGCYHRQAVAERNSQHGHSMRGHVSRTYSAWVSMWARVRGTSSDPRLYKDRGIDCCERWELFENFLADMGERPSSRHSLDRKDNDKGYSPDNCRWATAKQQARNRGTSRYVEAFGEKLTIAEWGERSGVTPNAILRRLQRGWSTERAVR